MESVGATVSTFLRIFCTTSLSPTELAEVVLGADFFLQVRLFLGEFVFERFDLLERQGVFDRHCHTWFATNWKKPKSQVSKEALVLQAKTSVPNLRRAVVSGSSQKLSMPKDFISLATEGQGSCSSARK